MAGGRNRRKEKPSIDTDVLMSRKVRIDNALGMFTVDSRSRELEVKKSGNGAVIPFLKRYINIIAFLAEQIDSGS